MPAKLPETEGRRYAMGFRTTLEGRTRIEEAARRSGRSVSQEIEARLEYSFAMDKHEEELSKSPVHKMIDEDTSKMLRWMETGAGAVMGYLNKSWKSDLFARMAVRASVFAAMETVFSKFKLDIDPEAVSLADLKKAEETGNLFGRILAASQDNPVIEEWISRRAAELAPGAADPVDETAEKNRLIKYLVGVDAA